jgi:hypothetical protein
MKHTFSAKSFAANTFASGTWAGKGIPSNPVYIPGIEYRVRDSRPHYTQQDARPHYVSKGTDQWS